MVTYEVRCGGCGALMLFERARQMADPGQLAAFCSPECSQAWFEGHTRELVQAGAFMFTADCGCKCLVMGTDSTMAWGVCQAGVGVDNSALQHRNQLSAEAVREFVHRQSQSDGARNEEMRQSAESDSPDSTTEESNG